MRDLFRRLSDTSNDDNELGPFLLAISISVIVAVIAVLLIHR